MSYRKVVKRLKRLTVIVVAFVVLLSPAPAFAQDYLNMNLLSKSDLRPEDIDRVFSKTPLEGLGKEFVRVEEVYGVNAQYFAAHAILESDWGRSKIAREKNNLFGFGAYDKAPYKHAKRFSSKEEGIDKVACFIKNEYLLPDGKYFNSPTLFGVNKKYATDSLWAQKVANHMKLFEPYLPVPRPQLKEETKELLKTKGIKTKDMMGMKTDMSTIWIGLTILSLIFILRKRSAVLLFLLAIPLALTKTLLFILKEIVLALAMSLKPALTIFYSSTTDDIKESVKLARIKRKAKKLAYYEARGAQLR